MDSQLSLEHREVTVYLAPRGTRRRSASEGKLSLPLAMLTVVLVFDYVALELKGVASHDIQAEVLLPSQCVSEG